MTDVVIAKYAPEHLIALQLQPAQAYCQSQITPEVLADVAELEAYTALVDGEPVAIAGLIEMWPGRAIAWSFVGANAGPHMVRITRAVERFLGLCEHRRIEAYVDPNFEAGHRWMRLLGFDRETPGVMRAFTPDGRDQVLYARVNHV